VSTLRHPIHRPHIVNNRRFVGLDDDDFSDEERKKKWKKVKEGIGLEYDPDAEYIYDARR